MRAFILVLRLLAAVAVAVGLLHLLIGLHADTLLGARLPAQVLADPVLDSQNRFYGTTFIGYGALIFLCAADLRRYAAVLALVAGFVALGGVARLLSIALHGMPPPPVLGLTLLELLGMPALLLWFRRVLPVA
ncbi:MAG: DUF4345 domain-containing protein [Nevskia sp.]|nr:DUF4345 domain-containing protein [Nevskia sp.]